MATPGTRELTVGDADLEARLDHVLARTWPDLSRSQIQRLIRDGQGTSGSGLDYLTNTVERLAELGIRDRTLERVLAATQRTS